MKKITRLLPLLTIAGVAATVAPIATSCSSSKIKVEQMSCENSLPTAQYILHVSDYPLGHNLVLQSKILNVPEDWSTESYSFNEKQKSPEEPTTIIWTIDFKHAPIKLNTPFVFDIEFVCTDPAGEVAWKDTVKGFSFTHVSQ